MSLSRLDGMCQSCPLVDECENKRIEAVGCLRYQFAEVTTESAAASQIAPMARETMTIHVNGKKQTVYRDEVERELYRSLYAGIGLQCGG